MWWKGRTRNVKKEVSIAQFLRLSLGETALDDFPVVGGGWWVRPPASSVCGNPTGLTLYNPFSPSGKVFSQMYTLQK